MKKIVFSFLLNILILAFVFSFFNGIKLPSDLIYQSLIFGGLSVSMIMHRPMLKFLTVNINILTYWLSASLLAIGTFYILNTFVPGLSIVKSVVRSMDFGAVTVASFEMSPMLVMVTSLALASLISAIMEALKKPSEE
ncbi:hypothetical protein IT417_01460 [bacterium]|nr:hypothetical protein [bacterium]